MAGVHVDRTAMVGCCADHLPHLVGIDKADVLVVVLAVQLFGVAAVVLDITRAMRCMQDARREIAINAVADG